jgi:hypothetical protein
MPKVIISAIVYTFNPNVYFSLGRAILFMDGSIESLSRNRR